MMKQEFEALAGYEVSMDDYNTIIEPMYMATDLTKEEFVKTISKKRFALKPLKSIIKEMKEIAKELERICTLYYDEDLSERLKELTQEYIGRKYGTFVDFFIHENVKFTCYYPTCIEIYDKTSFKNLEIINLI